MLLPEPPLDNLKRLLVMNILERRHSIIFSDFAKVLKISRGGLFTLLKPLEEAIYIVKEKKFVGVSPRVVIYPTIIGLAALSKAKLKLNNLFK